MEIENEDGISAYSLSNATYLHAAASWINQADRVLICAGAGMSVKKGTNVYVDEEDFAKFYPGMLKWGFTKAYQTMGDGLWGNPQLPMTVVWGFHGTHMWQQRYVIEPHEGYESLLNLIRGKDYFVWTSNVDGMFNRAGFDSKKIYKPQGDWEWLQCAGPCSPDAVFDSKPILEATLPFIKDCEVTDSTKIPKCPRCNKHYLRGNVRGGDWFIHNHSNSVQDKMIEWLRETEQSGLKLVIVEIGAGFNTPVVTRFPMESITRSFPNARLIRVNPTEPEVPLDLHAVGLKKGWNAFAELSQAIDHAASLEFSKSVTEVENEPHAQVNSVKEHNLGVDLTQGVPYNFHWAILKNLRR